MSTFLEKVTAFITRDTDSGTQLLLFQHPNAGVQLPAGTVEPGEPHLDAALREGREESGLDDLQVRSLIGTLDTRLPDGHFVVTRKTKVYCRPDLGSVDWAEFRIGLPVTRHRTTDEFSQVTFEEHDRYPDPTYITYSITGWVPTAVLARQTRRFFYHLTYSGGTPDRWLNMDEHHLLEPFWAPLCDLPAIIEPQQEWLDYVQRDLGYCF